MFLLEEASAKAMLESLLPRILDPQIVPRLIPFEGKQDLEKQMVKRLRHYLNPHARFIVMRDQDSHADCKALKRFLVKQCRDAGKDAVTLVRIACRELEAFYLADLAAVEVGLEVRGLVRHQQKAKFRRPDLLGSPSAELEELIKRRYQKVSGSRQIGQYLDSENVRSDSFRNLISGIRRLEHQLLKIPD
ncbi:DUF4276 family protein [Collimonas sp. OK412]|uniref:DUF4276 family protein n=1 Tax=Collimonas sp. (strain OK412) TaxID=1801619 RepID=UPI0020C8B071|nr:DUF4276 family protein [Collimonas sp. OK412]